MTTRTTAGPVAPERLPLLYRAIGFIERIGNLLPHPFWLFWIMAGLLGVISWVLSAAGVSVTLPESDEVVEVKNLLSTDGLKYAIESALDNFASFPPLAVVLVVLLGVSVAEKSGVLEALIRLTIIRLPKRWVTFAIAFSGMIAHIMGDAAYLVMIPLGAMSFKAAGRSPVLGVMVAYASVSAGFNASPLVTPSDAIRSSLASAAAQTVDSSASITPVATYFFSATSSMLLAVIITLVVELVLARREDFKVPAEESANASGVTPPGRPGEDDTDVAESMTLDDSQTRGLLRATAAGVVFIVAVVVILLLPDSPFIEPGQSLVESMVLDNIAIFISLFFTLTGMVYGYSTRAFTTVRAVPEAMIAGVVNLAPVIVLFFAVAQFLAYFSWTGIGSVLTVNGADLLQRLEAPHLVVLIVIIVGVAFINMIVTSGSAMWAIFAPILVPMMMYYGVRPEAAMVSFMIGDSVTNAVTPMSAYFVLALGYVQRYRKDAGIGTLMAFTVPLSVAILIGWGLFFCLWYLLGIPLGPGVVLH
ncbi:AbgT family transporter [Brevibacterium marinum]|uniref:Aminobenzoyl-glutamate transport protein n=1 Tax=Brevibacterium marinum TaxID=418643 RepID=A0A846S4R1_9MICO|nr:AbgT family transporter [Brevibacterium marinum]NJC57071.1 aminobenzoyl-glutamate transport protein [Brevibacterium marinum]